MLAHRTAIPMSSSIDSEHMLRRVFAAAIADHQEGVVLKANESTYNAKNLPWIKVRVFCVVVPRRLHILCLVEKRLYPRVR